jgi:exosome complex RNA-binding protein Rrp42 (RNase PH superfamily)
LKPDIVRLTALWFTGVVALLGMVIFGCCAIWKIYIDVPMMLVLSNITIAAVSAFTTLLTGRNVAQLNQQSEVKNQPQIDTAQP